MDADAVFAQPQARLFTLRIWSVEGDAERQWRVRLQDVQSGEVNYFKDLKALCAFLDQRLREEQQESLYSQKDER